MGSNIIYDVGVDPVSLVEMAEIIFAQADFVRGMTFEQFVDTVLNDRKNNMATVKDIRSQLGVMKATVKEDCNGIMRKISDEFSQLRFDMQELRPPQEVEDVSE